VCLWSTFDSVVERACRYVLFSIIQAFLDIAVQAAAKTCTSFEKVQDGNEVRSLLSSNSEHFPGIINRVFSLVFHNDVEFITKIPFGIAGP